MATAFRPSCHDSRWSASTSSTVASSGMLTVLEMAPEMNGCTAPIIRTWPVVVDRVVAHRAGEHRQVVGLQVRGARRSTCARRCRRRSRRPAGPCSRGGAAPAGTVWLTIDIVPPPTSFLNLTSPRSGSMPVVSQSIIRPIVPVGASTDGLAVADAELLAAGHGVVPGRLGGRQELGRHQLLVDARRPRRGAGAARRACAPRCRRSRRTGPCGRRCGRDVA